MRKMASIQREYYKRGAFGKFVKWVFIIFNVLMLIWVVSGMGNAGHQYQLAASDAERAGTAIGASLGFGLLMFIWITGAVILGIATLLTRGTKYIVTEDKDS